jgi:hypothetical protein
MSALSMIDVSSANGRALYTADDGGLYISRGYEIFRSGDQGASWELDCFVPDRGWQSLPASCALGRRLFRRYIQTFQVASDGSRIAVARDGIYRADRDEIRMRRRFTLTRGSRPLNLCVDGCRVLFGEYGDGLRNPGPRLYLSADCGRTYDVIREFPTDDIRHIHNVVLDPFTGDYWVLAGDFGAQPGVGILSRNGKNFDWLARGKQVFRAVSVLVGEEYLTYGTDSSTEPNCIGRLHKKTGGFEKLRDTEGSSLYAGRCGGTWLISTCVEPNPAAPARTCSLYASRDGMVWNPLAAYRKDGFHAVYFQFGTLVLPSSAPHGGVTIFSGQALAGFHDRCRVIRLAGAL